MREIDCPFIYCPKCYANGIEVKLEFYNYKSPKQFWEEQGWSRDTIFRDKEKSEIYSKSLEHVCLKCGFRETEFDKDIRLRNNDKILTKEYIIKELQKEGTDTNIKYFCSMCRCNHNIITERGFDHRYLRNKTVGDKNKCVICKGLLPPRKKKFCSNKCKEINKYTCQRCGKYWKTDKPFTYGSTTHRLCSECNWGDWEDTYSKFANLFNPNTSAKDFEILGLEPTATPEEIKKQYRKLAKHHHPDLGGDEETMKKINEAYENLAKQKK